MFCKPTLFLALSLCVQPALAEPPWSLEGDVSRAMDGDTVLLVEKNHNLVTVRLSDIDAPELVHGRTRPGQPFGLEARQSLEDLVGGQPVSAVCYERDRWGRAVCTLFVHGQDVNAEQLRRGLAWVNRANSRYVRNAQSVTLEGQARASGLGLWADPHRTPPWLWRRDCWAQHVCDATDIAR